MQRTLMIDGDIVLFKLGRVTEDITDFGDVVLESYDKESFVRLLDIELDNIGKRTGYSRDEMVFAVSSKTNFRKRFFPTYKGNRKDVKKPIGLKDMVEYMLENSDKYQTIMIEELEADDVMGMYATAPSEVSGNEVAIYSQDKDLKTIPAKQWDFKKGEFITPTRIESLRYLYTQVLTGDTVDGYGGCSKIGKVKAEKALKDCEKEIDMLAACHKLYYKVYEGQAMEKLLDQMGQARIFHFADSQLFFSLDMLYDPYTVLGVPDEVLQMWEEESRRSNKPKRVRKKQVRETVNTEV